LGRSAVPVSVPATVVAVMMVVVMVPLELHLIALADLSCLTLDIFRIRTYPPDATMLIEYWPRNLTNKHAPQSEDFNVPNDPLVLASLLRWGNYDVVTGAPRWCGTGDEAGCDGISEIPTTGVAFINGNAVPESHNLEWSKRLERAEKA
jgi:hypothetical protein